MSVLIEALTLVVRRSDLDARFPGGTAAFVEAAAELRPAPRFVCDADEDLVAASFYGPEHLEPCAALLREHGLGVGEADGDVALVDQDLGPLDECAWLGWARHDEGFAYAWLGGGETPYVTADEAWRPERSRALVRRASLDQPGRLFRLSGEGGIATWLDLTTGKQVVGSEPATAGAGEGNARDPRSFLGDCALEPEIATALPVGEVEVSPDPDAERLERARMRQLRARIREALEAEEIGFTPWGRFGFEADLSAENVVVTVRIAVARQGHMVRVYAMSDLRVPEEHRAAACEALTRANYGLPVGDFELDLRDGEVTFKGTIFLASDGQLGVEQVAAAIRGGVYVYDRYYPALMRVIYGGATPEEAIAEVEE